MSFDVDSATTSGITPTITAMELTLTCGFNPLRGHSQDVNTPPVYYLSIRPSSDPLHNGDSPISCATAVDSDSVEVPPDCALPSSKEACNMTTVQLSEGQMPIMSPILNFGIHDPSKSQQRFSRIATIQDLLARFSPKPSAAIYSNLSEICQFRDRGIRLRDAFVEDYRTLQDHHQLAFPHSTLSIKQVISIDVSPVFHCAVQSCR
ncbi:hypothetical protein C8Q80DRAFT_613038 [Daedaleopsis nitida]|nr:hypothetical protein C8Q80DRAFT_613038 [Daedaleopsis nitida]